jgi:hypothetical protein
MDEKVLVCPSCGARHPAQERFCADCSVPLVFPRGEPADAREQQPLNDLWRRARRIKPQYSEGELVRVAGARNLAEADFIQGLLLEEGIPSLQRRARGFDVPDFLAAGPRELLVPASGVSAAREVLLQSELIAEQSPAGPWSWAALRVMIGLLAGLALLAGLLWLGSGH